MATLEATGNFGSQVIVMEGRYIVVRPSMGLSLLGVLHIDLHTPKALYTNKFQT